MPVGALPCPEGKALLLIFERSALLLTGTNSASWLRSKITKISAFLLLLLIFERSSRRSARAPTGTISALPSGHSSSSSRSAHARVSALKNKGRHTNVPGAAGPALFCPKAKGKAEQPESRAGRYAAESQPENKADGWKIRLNKFI